MTLFNRILSSQAIRDPRKFFHFGDVKFDLEKNKRKSPEISPKQTYRETALIIRKSEYKLRKGPSDSAVDGS